MISLKLSVQETERRISDFVQNIENKKSSAQVLVWEKSTYPRLADGQVFSCGYRFPYVLFNSFRVDNHPEKELKYIYSLIFSHFSGRLSTVIMTKAEKGWFASVFLIFYNKDKKEKEG